MVIAQTKKETKKIEFGTRFDKAHRSQELTKVKINFNFLSIFAKK